MNLKFRSKGQVKEISFPTNDIPACLLPTTPGLEGIDLTGGPVIYMRCGRHGADKAARVHASAPSTIVIYEYEWRNGWGQGILLPEGFTPRKVKHYESDAQKEAKATALKRVAFEQLQAKVSAAFPGFRAYTSFDGVISVAPMQEVYALDHWAAEAFSIEEVQSLLEEYKPLWEEWNARVLEIWMRRSGQSNPGSGNIQLHPSPLDPSLGLFKHVVGICLDRSSSMWVHLQRQKDGSWKEDPKTYYSPPMLQR